uniref:ABC-transporter extension domain-containing protein n=1 Tax=Oryza rufipogon TaxID=4529 RepID=A0A0E0PJM8_ORYRU
MSKTHKANYSEYVLAKAIWVETQYATWEKQQEEIEQTKELINRLGAGVNAGRVWSEQKGEWQWRVSAERRWQEAVENGGRARPQRAGSGAWPEQVQGWR